MDAACAPRLARRALTSAEARRSAAEAGGEPKLGSCEGVAHVHPARRPWSELMDAVQRRVLPKAADEATTAASEAERRNRLSNL